MQNYDEDSYKGDKLKFDVKYPKELLKLHIKLLFWPWNMKIEESKNSCAIYMTRTTMSWT